MGLLRTGINTIGAIGLSLMGGGAAVMGGLRYLLRAIFDAANQGFANGQVLDTVAEGVQDGQLTVVEVDGTLAIVSNECAFTAQGTPAWGDLGLVGEALGGGGFTKVLGRGLIVTFNLSTWEEMGIGWHTAAAVTDPDNMPYAVQANATDGRLDLEGGTQIWSGLALNTDHKWIIVLGGYNATGEAWYTGQPTANYVYGASHYFYDGVNWNLAWRDKADNTTPLYAIASMLDGVGTVELPSGIPTADLSAVLQPVVDDTFTDANGTSLDAHVKEVGGAWTEQVGDWDIQGNKANPSGVDGQVDRATMDAAESDVLLRVTCNVGQSVTSDKLGLILRWSDVNNYWFVWLEEIGDFLRLHEVNGGVTTLRAHVAATVNQNTAYDVVAIMDGQDFTAFLDGGNRVAYGSAALNETETEMGLRSKQSGAITNNNQFDNFHVHARRSAIYDATLNAV